MNPILLFVGEEVCVGGAIGEDEVSEDAEKDGRCSFEDQKPAPTGEVQPVDVVEDQAGKRRADDAGDGHAEEENSEGASLFAFGEPVSEIEADAGKVAGFGEAEEKARGVELVDVLDQAVESGERAPGNEDAGDPDAGAEFVEEEIAGDFENTVADEEYSSEQAELLGSDGQGAVHGERGEADVDAVEVRGDVEDEEEGKEVKANFADGEGAGGGGGHGWTGELDEGRYRTTEFGKQECS